MEKVERSSSRFTPTLLKVKLLERNVTKQFTVQTFNSEFKYVKSERKEKAFMDSPRGGLVKNL